MPPFPSSSLSVSAALTCLIMIFLTACSDSSDGSVQAQDRLTPAEACVDPEDCRLWEAGKIAGVNVGLATAFPEGSPETDIALMESSIANNHAFSWSSFEPARDQYRFDELERRALIANNNSLPQNAFHFAWENVFLDDMPDWVAEITAPDELLGEIRQRATIIFDRYPNIAKINVINEPLPTLGTSGELEENHFYQVLGPDYIEQLFHLVDAAAPDNVELVLNENFVEYFPEKALGLVDLVRELVAAEAPIDSVGFQTHLMLTEILHREPDFELLRSTMEQVAALGVNVWISELDNPVDPARTDRFEYQAENYRKVVEICLAIPRCTDIQIWGVQDGPSYWFTLPYEDVSPLLFDRDFQPKPAYFAVRDALLRGRPH